MASTDIAHSQGDTASSHIVVPLIINGKEEEGPVVFDIVSPYTNRTCWKATSATPNDAIRAVEAAEHAFPAWSKTKPTVRRDILLKAADILESRLEQNAEIMRTEMGADVGASQFFVIPLSIRMLRDIAGRITSICGSVPVVEEEGQSAIIYKEPMGVILGIVPWYVIQPPLSRYPAEKRGMLRMSLGSARRLVPLPPETRQSSNHLSCLRAVTGLSDAHSKMPGSHRGVSTSCLVRLKMLQML